MAEKRGFTLIELMIVVGIIGILVSIAIPTYDEYRNSSYNAAALMDANSAKQSLTRLKAVYKYYGSSQEAGTAGTGVGIPVTSEPLPPKGGSIINRPAGSRLG